MHDFCVLRDRSYTECEGCCVVKGHMHASVLHEWQLSKDTIMDFQIYNQAREGLPFQSRTLRFTSMVSVLRRG
jgi:hypothetical protein